MSERRAYRCQHKDHEKGVAPRIFVEADRPLDYVPACPEHGRRYMVRQVNAPYHGPEA